MYPVLRNYTDTVSPKSFYTTPNVLGNINDVKSNSKTCIYTSPALKANFIQLKKNDKYFDNSNYNSSIYYIISGNGIINDTKYDSGDVLCINSFANIHAHDDTNIYNVEDSPLMNYYKMKTQQSHNEHVLRYTHDSIMNEITKIEQECEDNPNRLGVIFGTENNNSISNTLWCLMTKTLPHAIQPAHRHNSIALDYCVKGNGYTLLSKTRNSKGDLVDPIQIDWKEGMVFLTPPGWWHSHHSIDNEPGYIFPVQDAGLHMYLDTLDIVFS